MDRSDERRPLRRLGGFGLHAVQANAKASLKEVGITSEAYVHLPICVACSTVRLIPLTA